MSDIAPDAEVEAVGGFRVLRQVWSLLGAYRGRVMLAVLVIILQAGAAVAGPAAVRYGIDAGVRHRDLSALTRAAGLFFASAVAAYGLGRAMIRVIAEIGQAFLRDLRKRVFDHLLSLSLDFFEVNRTGALVSRMTADIDAMQDLVGQGLSSFIASGLLFVGTVIIMVTMSWQLSAAVLVVVPLLAKATSWFGRASDAAYLALRERIGTTLTSMQEGLVGVRVSQAFGQEPTLSREFRSVNEAQVEAHLKTQRLAALYFPTVDLAKGIAIAATLGVGGLLSSRAHQVVTVGTVAAFVLYLQNVFDPIQQLSQLFNTLQSSVAALKKLFGLLDVEPSVAERPEALELPLSGTIALRNVSFRYAPDAPPALDNVTIEVQPGERLAVVGPTGAGKSTLAKLMTRFYDPSEGVVTFGGMDFKDATIASLHKRIVVIPQEGFLFGGTVRDNLLLGREGTSDDSIRSVLDSLGIGEHLLSLPNGLDTEIHQRGSNLSSGQRQLVSLARSALADPAVLVLDEATSSLDLGTEMLVERAFERLMAGRTVIIIAHRLSTAERADRVAMVDGARVIEHGPHEELLARGGAYARLFRAWEGTAPVG